MKNTILTALDSAIKNKQKNPHATKVWKASLPPSPVYQCERNTPPLQKKKRKIALGA